MYEIGDTPRLIKQIKMRSLEIIKPKHEEDANVVAKFTKDTLEFELDNYSFSTLASNQW